jgi:Na+-driven multidrug efflux pump
MKQINMLESPVRQVFFSYLVPSISATLVTSIYILADTMMIGRGVGGSGIAAMNILLQHIFRDRNDVRSRRQRSLWVFQRTRR